MYRGDDDGVPLKAHVIDTACEPGVYYTDEQQPTPFASEKRKTALNPSFAPTRYIIHILAVGFTAAVVQLTFRQVYVSDDGAWEKQKWTFGLGQTEVANILQFPAKVHELFIVGSLSTMIFGIIRRRLVGQRGVPFGFLSGGYQVGSPTYIFSKSFASPFWAALRGKKRGLITIGFILFLSMLYANVVGPSSAVLIVPSLEWYDMHNPYDGEPFSVYQTDSVGDVWPETMSAKLARSYPSTLDCSTAEHSQKCPAGGSDVLSQWVEAYANQGVVPNVTMSQTYSQATRELRSVSAAENPTVKIAITVDAVIGELAGIFWNYVNNNDVGQVSETLRPKFQLTPESKAYSPLVRTECEPYDFDDLINHEIEAYFPALLTNDPSTPVKADPAFWEFVHDGEGLGFFFEQNRGLRNQTYAATAEALGGSIIGATLTPYLRQKEGFKEQRRMVTICMIDARWAGTTVSFDPSTSDKVEHNLTALETDKDTAQLQLLLDYRNKYSISNSIPFDIDWADLMNAKAPSSVAVDKGDGTWNADLFSSYLLPFVDSGEGEGEVRWANGSISAGGEFKEFKPPQLGSNFDEYKANMTDTIATIMSLAVADGVARSTAPFFGYNLIVKHNETFVETIDLLRQQGERKSEVTETIRVEDLPLTDNTFFTFSVKRYGWGYSMGHKTVQFSLVVVLLHSALVLFYFVMDVMQFLTRHWTSSTWESLDELVALALRSSPPVAMEGSGAGIDKGDTYVLDVKIRETSDHTAELVVGNGDRMVPQEYAGDRNELMRPGSMYG